MRERNPAGQALGAGELVDGSLSPSPEVAVLLGEDVVRYMDRAAGALGELGAMAEIADPFAQDERGCQVDLGFLKSDQATLVHDYRAISKPFRGMHPASIARLGRKIMKNAPGIHKDVDTMLDAAKPAIDEAEGSIGKVADEIPENAETSVLADLQRCMEELTTARDRLPSPATMIIVDNLYAVGVSARNHVQSMAQQNKRIRLEPPKAVKDFTQMLKDGREKLKDVAKRVGGMRQLGTANFDLLQKLIKVERIKEAEGMIITADTARQRLPGDMDSLEGEELEAAKAAERYLMEHVALASSVLEETDPEVLQNATLRPMVARLRPSAPEPESAGQQPERRPNVGDGVLAKLTETKNVLRGGRRLKPGKGQTESDVQRTADGLHGLKDGGNGRMLEPEETGLIVAMVVGRFEELSEVMGAVQRHERQYGQGAFPSDRSGVVHEICRFDLPAALVKINGLMDDPDARLHLERVLGMPNARTVSEQLSQALAAEEEPADEAA